MNRSIPTSHGELKDPPRRGRPRYSAVPRRGVGGVIVRRTDGEFEAVRSYGWSGSP